MVSRHRKTVDFKLYAVNDSEISTYGRRSVTIDLGLRRRFTWDFIVANVSQPILGADFLQHFNLLVDLNRRKLLNSTTQLSASGRVTHTPTPALSTINVNGEYHDLLREFVDITNSCVPKKGKHEVQHFIETKGPPVAEPARRLSPEKLKQAKAEFGRMLEQGICRPSSGQWASPLHLVPKKLRDYRRLYAETTAD
ncbi:uncharacterized protein LOC115237853 [Formica exsecta]|uniref:uncharacterized protein LOC115237853 n=1 Tax=Formica exsecta TaxID=72781 RepID=UPI001143665A|nr:uncharacterized protein LOC115237853 [Formica exsecta]